MSDGEMPKKLEKLENDNEFYSLDDSFPSEQELFKQIMLTNEAVWNNRLSKNDIENWLSNFKGEVFDISYERQLALWLLANFVFYNENEVRHLCKTLYREFIHQMLQREIKRGVFNIEDSLKQIYHTSRFYHLGKPGESGAFILYYFRHENKLPLQIFINRPEKLPSDVTNIIFIDDVTISGKQADKYLERETISYDEDKTKILLTFFSTNEAVQLLGENDIQVISCIILDERSKCFSDNSSQFQACRGKLEDCKKFATIYGEKSLKFHSVSLHPLGFMHGEYTFGFFYNTPDNTLPIFWADNQGWKPIMKRYEKLTEEIYDGLGKFL